jgi:hypothetical protein
MKWRHIVLIFAVLPTLAGRAPAWIFFNRHAKAAPPDQVPALIQTIRTERSDRKREAAVQELRQYDVNAYPEVVPTLVDLVKSDPSAGVRLEAVESLAHIQPPPPQAASVLEQAQSHDSSLRVRWQARRSLQQYHGAGIRDPKAMPVPAEGGPTVAGPLQGEPPLAAPVETPAAPRLVPRPIEQGPVLRPAEPVRAVPVARPFTGPLRQPTVNSVPAKPPGGSSVPRPLPPGPVTPPLVPADPPPLTTPPASTEGPALTPPY